LRSCEVQQLRVCGRGVLGAGRQWPGAHRAAIQPRAGGRGSLCRQGGLTMALPYENATSGGAALEEIRKLLTKFGCARFGTMTDAENGALIVQFSHRGRDVTATASYR